MLQQHMGGAANYTFPQRRMTVAAGYQQVGIKIGCITEQDIRYRLAGRHRSLCLGADAMPGKVVNEVGSAGLIGCWLPPTRAHRYNGDRGSLGEKGKSVVHRARRLTAVVPGDKNSGADRFERTDIGDNQRRATGGQQNIFNQMPARRWRWMVRIGLGEKK